MYDQTGLYTRRPESGGVRCSSAHDDQFIWVEYFSTLHLGVRRYLNKEKESSLPAARNKDMVLLVFHVIWQLFIMGLLWYIFAWQTGLTLATSAWIAPIIYVLYNLL
ncbi:hypothetical protein B5X24_HaOG212437 [Helicoverpa armigera]|uniref:Uncharacterized protein n=1 Tax=Helicoverpa armigera TaxID=29058 RepID=A0A2W1B764_HELAM|nr:hypothetical protein B5X24_HaOG212437 [Helicoverpa armigera]